MWSSNWFWNIALLALGIGLAALSFGVFRSTDTFLARVAGPDSRIVAERSQSNFWVSSFDGAIVSYTDEWGDTTEYVGDEQIVDFCIDVLGK